MRPFLPTITHYDEKVNHILIARYHFYFIACAQPLKYELVISNVGLFDGESDRGVVNIGIRNDSLIAIISEKLKADSVIDGTSKYLVPGMVISHVHASNTEKIKEGYPYGILAHLNMYTGLEEREIQ